MRQDTQIDNQASSSDQKKYLVEYFQGFQISPSKSNDMVSEALQIDTDKDDVGLNQILDAFKKSQIELTKDSSLQQKQEAKEKLFKLFADIFKKTRDYFSVLGIDVSKFSYPNNLNDQDNPNVSKLGKYIVGMISGGVDGVDNKTYAELLVLANNIGDFVQMVASRANQDGIKEEEKKKILEKCIVNLPITQNDLACIPGTAERFETLANELKLGLVMQAYVASSTIAQGVISAELYEGNQIHTPLFLKMLLGIIGEKAADKQDRFVVGLKTDLTKEICWQAVQTYYQEFSDNFILLITEQLENLLDEEGNVFGVKYKDLQDLLKDTATYPELNKKLNLVLEKLGLSKEEISIGEFIDTIEFDDKEDEYQWKTKEEIAELIATKLIAKYPALTRISPQEQNLKSILQPSKAISDFTPTEITQLLQSDNPDQVLIGLQLIYLSSQPFKNNGGYYLMVSTIYSQIGHSKPQTMEDFVSQVRDNGSKFLESLKSKIPQDQHFKIEDLQARLKDDEAIKETSYLVAINHKNNSLEKQFIRDNKLGAHQMFAAIILMAAKNELWQVVEDKMTQYKLDSNFLCKNKMIIELAISGSNRNGFRIISEYFKYNQKVLSAIISEFLFSYVSKSQWSKFNGILQNCGSFKKEVLKTAMTLVFL
jgi:hypothetical protein